MTESPLSPNSQSVRLDIFAKEASIALMIKAAGLVLIYVLQIFLARWMGRTEYGIYEYVIAWSLLLAIPASLGLPRTVLRSISQYRVSQEWGLARGIIRGSLFLTLGASFLLCGIAIAVVLWINSHYQSPYALPLLLGIGLIPLQALVQLQLETIRALEDIISAYLPSLVLWPLLVLCGGFLLFQIDGELKSIPAIAVATISFIIILIFQRLLLWERIKQILQPALAVYSYRQWINVSLVLLLQRAFLYILDETDIIMVGSLVSPEAAGIYNVAVKTALWVGFVLEIIIIVAAPAFAILYTQNNLAELQRVVSRVTVWIFWPSVAIGSFLLIFAAPVLSIFGSEFLPAIAPLKILVAGRLVDSLCGTVACLMVMTGYQNKSLPVFAFSAMLNLVLNAIAIPKFGMVGAAMTTSFTLVVWNIWLSILVIKYTSLQPSIFYTFFNSDRDREVED
ncbi:MAG: polysaccharide biosynthesis C-terminal domain-containing protein [Cyanobacteria bacterium P01_E01_bin.42]